MSVGDDRSFYHMETIIIIVIVIRIITLIVICSRNLVSVLNSAEEDIGQQLISSDKNK